MAGTPAAVATPQQLQSFLDRLTPEPRGTLASPAPGAAAGGEFGGYGAQTDYAYGNLTDQQGTVLGEGGRSVGIVCLLACLLACWVLWCLGMGDCLPGYASVPNHICACICWPWDSGALQKADWH